MGPKLNFDCNIYIYKHRYYVIILISIWLIAALLRLKASFTDFWLDEIWSLNIYSMINSPIELFTKLKHDNNHILITFFMYILDDQQNWFVYRIPALVAGIASLVVLIWITHCRGRIETTTVVLLAGFSYILIVYSSEARGYAPAVFFSLVSFKLVEQYLRKKSWLIAMFYCLTVLFGFLSHLTFVYLYIANMVWSGYVFIKECKSLYGLHNNVLLWKWIEDNGIFKKWSWALFRCCNVFG